MVNAPFTEEKVTTTTLKGKDAMLTLNEDVNEDVRSSSFTSNAAGPSITTAGVALPKVGWLVGELVGAMLGV